MSEITVDDHVVIQKRAVRATVEYAACAQAVMDYLTEMGKAGVQIHPGMMIETTRGVVELYCAEKIREGAPIDHADSGPAVEEVDLRRYLNQSLPPEHQR